MNDGRDRRPLIVAGLLLGSGLGGFVDGILFHQILQWHGMLSARLPPDTLVNAKVNMFWDGIFHSAVWFLTVIGVWRLFVAGRRTDIRWSAKLLIGAMLMGWGLFNVIEGLINHHLLQLHHVRDDLRSALSGDLIFLASGLLLCAAGAALVSQKKVSAHTIRSS